VNPLEAAYRFARVRGRLGAAPFKFLNLGLLAYVGKQEALAQVQAGDSIEVRWRCAHRERGGDRRCAPASHMSLQRSDKIR
jgi:hypothetical protein